MPLRKVTTYLIIDVSGEVKVAKTDPSHRLKFTEIAYKLEIVPPVGWGRVMPEPITIDLPGPTSNIELKLLPASSTPPERR